MQLRNSSNIIENNCADLFEKYFQNYEEFWNQFLIPLLVGTGNWRNDTIHNLEEIGMSQYGVLKSLNFIILSKSEIIVRDPLQRYKNIYFHFGLIFDSVNNLARNICIVGELLKIIPLDKRLKRKRISLLLNYMGWINEKYDKSYKRMLEWGIPIYYYPQYDLNFISILLPKQISKKYKIFERSIKDYRNFYIHTPGVDIIRRTTDQRLFAIKKEYLNQYRHWSNIQISFMKNHIHFENPQIIVEDDLIYTLKILNEVWTYFIEKMNTITNHPRYSEYSHNFVRNIR